LARFTAFLAGALRAAFLAAFFAGTGSGTGSAMGSGVLTGKGQGASTLVGAGPNPNIFLMKSIMMISFGVFTSILGSYSTINLFDLDLFSENVTTLKLCST
jgi:hypothetical protein